MRTEKERMTLLEFEAKFSEDEKCRDFLYQTRWPGGPVCGHCGGRKFYKIKDRDVYECADCGHQISLTAGTVMERHHAPLRKWFWAIYLVAEDKRGISGVQLQKEIGVRYSTAWTMLHKIRKAMGDRDARYQLGGIVELDDTYFGGPSEGEKRGRGTEKTLVEVALSLDTQGRPQFVKMEVIPDIKNETLTSFAERNIAEGSAIDSDAYASYIKAFKNSHYEYKSLKFNPIAHPDHLKWLHRIIGNAKAFILGTFHGLDSLHLQSYLNEFCYRMNRRRFASKLFNRLLLAVVSTKTITYKQLTHPVLNG
jgi:transposase-like protein